jgi:YVTN family beta-propeller protein
MKKISTNVVSRLRLGAPILAAAMLAAISLPSSLYAAPTVTANIPIPLGLEPDGLVVSGDGNVLYGTVLTPGTFLTNFIVINTQFNTITAITPLFHFHLLGFPASYGGLQVAEAPAENLLYVLNFGKTGSPASIDVVNEATNTQINTFESPQVGPNPIGFAITPDGSQLWVANAGPGFNNGTVQVVSTATGLAIAQVNVGGNPNTVVFNSTGTIAYVLNTGSFGFPPKPGWVDSVSTSTFDIIKNNIALKNGNINFPNPLAMAISKNNKSLLIANGFSTLLQVDVPTGLVPSIAQMFTIANPGVANQAQAQVVRSLGGATVYEAANLDSAVRFASTTTFLSRKPIKLPAGSRPYFMALSPNGTTLYVSDYDNTGLITPFTAGNKVISVITGVSPN